MRKESTRKKCSRRSSDSTIWNGRCPPWSWSARSSTPGSSKRPSPSTQSAASASSRGPRPSAAPGSRWRWNALHALKARLSEQGTQGMRLAALREGLGLPDTVQRIECFDVSHTMGEAAVAACVVYDRMDMRRGEYRRYNIEGVTPGDDYGALAQALARRYGRIAGGEGTVPDLIFIDGGKGQVSAAKEALAETGLSDIALVGIAKGTERKPGLEELWIGERAVRLSPDHAGLHLIQRIRDEAHRFAS